jgi:hypothetical protein
MLRSMAIKGRENELLRSYLAEADSPEQWSGRSASGQSLQEIVNFPSMSLTSVRLASSIHSKDLFPTAGPITIDDIGPESRRKSCTIRKQQGLQIECYS